MLPLIFDKRLFLYLFFGFIFTLVIGIVSHEWGHWIVSKHYRFKKSRLCYAHTSYCGFNVEFMRYTAIYKQYTNEIHNNQDYPLKKEFDGLQKIITREFSLISAGGLLLTMLTGTIGFFLIVLFRKKFTDSDPLSFGQWLLVFLSLFWLREITLLTGAIIVLFTGHLHYYACEFKLARDLHWHPWSIIIVAGIAGLFVSCLVLFRFIPARQRFTFIIAGFTGGLTGAYLWLILLGPRLMP